MMWDGFNKRKFPRINLRCELILRDSPKGEVLRTQTENLGAGGVCVILDRCLQRFSILSLRLEIDSQLPWIETVGKVIWAISSRDAASNKECYDTGIEFLGLDPGHQDLIRRYVESRAEMEERL